MIPPRSAQEHHSMTAKKTIQLICVPASLAALLWLLHRIGWPTIAGAVGKVGWQGAALLLLLGFAESTLDGGALWTVMGPPLRLGFAIAVNAAGSTLNLVLPWESGEFLKGGLLHGQFGTGRAISGTVLWNYVFKLSRPTVSLLSALVAWWLCQNLDGTLIVLVVVANLLAFAPYVGLRILIRFGAAAGLLRILRRLPIIGRHPAHWGEVARSIDQQVQSFGRERRTAFVRVFVMQVLARLTGWLSIYVIFRALGLGYTFGQATLIYATMNVADYVIALLPARVGVSEGTAFVVFKLFGLDPAMGLIIFTILRVRTIVANGVVTPLAFVKWQPPNATPADGA